jgi:hypothetical protein
MNHPLSAYSNPNHKPIWGYAFLGACAYVILSKKFDRPEIPLLENPARKKRFMEILKPLEELSAFAHKIMTEKKIIGEKYNYTLNSTDMFFPDAVKNVTERFHSPEQITEILKQYRAKFFLENLVPHEFGFLKELVKNKKLLRKYNRIAREAHWYKENGYDLQGVSGFWQSREIKHHFDNARANEIWEILNLDLKAIKSPAELKIILGRIEGDWIEKKRLEEPSPVRQGEVFIDCGNGYKWIYLDTPTCKMEADAMAHCGNTGGSEDARIISLREFKKDKKGKVVEIPHLTFIGYEREEKFGLMSEKFYLLGEMKGYANSKPTKKYHPQIMKLILDGRIMFLVGGGYKPENNFELDDLSPENLEIVKRQKPQFFDVKLMLDQTPERMNAFLQVLTQSEQWFEPGEEGDFGPRNYILDTYDNLEELIKIEPESEWKLPDVSRRRQNTTVESLFDSLSSDDWLYETYRDYGDHNEYETVQDIIRYMEKKPKGRKALKNLNKILKPYGKKYDDLPELFYNFSESGEFRDNEENLYDEIRHAIEASYVYATGKYHNRLAISAMNEEKWGAGLYLKFSDKESIWKPVSIQIDKKDLIDFCEKVIKYGYERSGEPLLVLGTDHDYTFSIQDPRDNLSIEYDPQDGADHLTHSYGSK